MCGSRAIRSTVRIRTIASHGAGEMAEWLKAHAWKACLLERVTWVRIPLSPPYFQQLSVGHTTPTQHPLNPALWQPAFLGYDLRRPELLLSHALPSFDRQRHHRIRSSWS